MNVTMPYAPLRRHRQGCAGTTGWLYGNFSQLKLQAEAAVFIIVLIAVATFVILKTIGRFVPLRMDAKTLEIGDAAVHGEEA
jgi:Amt family ammonium transporter